MALLLAILIPYKINDIVTNYTTSDLDIHYRVYVTTCSIIYTALHYTKQ